jgi:hypothetical protein
LCATSATSAGRRAEGCSRYCTIEASRGRGAIGLLLLLLLLLLMQVACPSSNQLSAHLRMLHVALSADVTATFPRSHDTSFKQARLHINVTYCIRARASLRLLFPSPSHRGRVHVMLYTPV